MSLNNFNIFRYSVTTCSFCGDSYIRGTQGEECDDGRDPTTLLPVSGDGCSSTCLIEDSWTCTPNGGVPAATDIQGPSVCSFSCIQGTNVYFYDAVTGDWMYNQKPCDDGNTVNGDGCTQYCNVETGWTCNGGTDTSPDTCTEICGDGYDYGNYPCDDGNLVDGDGCSSTC